MKMGRRGTGIAVVLSAVALTAGIALAQTMESGPHHTHKNKPEANEGMESGMRGPMMGGGMMGGMMGPMMCGRMMGPMTGGMMRGMMGRHGMMGMDEHPMMDVERMMGAHLSMCIRHAEKLGISEEQIERLRAVHNEQAKKLIRLRSEIQVLNVDLRSELAKDSPDFSRVESLLKKREPLRTDFFLEGLRTRADASKILTAEQRKKLHKMMMEAMTGDEES
jgi:Spy/CpxP family protein refolding chaperone